MRVMLAKLRLALHLLCGAWIVATRFPRLTAARRVEINRIWSLKLLELVGMRLVVHNDAARLDQRTLVVGNHISWIDIYVINAWRPTPFVSKAEVRAWPVIGWLAAQLDTVFLQREKRRDAKRIMHELATRLEAGGCVCMFPEGTTSDGLALLPFHSNLFQAALAAQCAVQPICLLYEDSQGRQSTAPAYVGDTSLLESLDTLLRNGPVTAHLYVGEPIAPVGDRRELAAQARQVVAAGLAMLQAGTKTPPESVPREAQSPDLPAGPAASADS
ncbi:lysophospholipid acyltransferase family protein [Trinickia acidisoli]|uniref:lysophospholipid acyltransferase family protein n=1 Tax=Trinickia acidisoli TaxID=2767482 RepID=UPI001A8F1D56|nr:lysophospholipid acyltransferase family protein [Trinickia acidisoli]